MNLKNLLCKIQTDNANLSHGYLLSSDVTQHHLGTLRCRWQGVSTPSLLSGNQQGAARNKPLNALQSNSKRRASAVEGFAEMASLPFAGCGILGSTSHLLS